MAIKISNLRKAVVDYQKANAGGRYSPKYGYLMLNRNTGELWTDTFYNIRHNSYKKYSDKAIVDLVRHVKMWTGLVFDVNMFNVQKWAEWAIDWYQTG